jgi:hypothetical protein
MSIPILSGLGRDERSELPGWLDSCEPRGGCGEGAEACELVGEQARLSDLRTPTARARCRGSIRRSHWARLQAWGGRGRADGRQ